LESLNSVRISLPGRTLINTIEEFFWKDRDFNWRRGIHGRQYNDLRTFLRGVKVQVQISENKPARTPRVIKDLIEDVGSYEFDSNNGRITVAVRISVNLLFRESRFSRTK
jgi:hypothetical protein